MTIEIYNVPYNTSIVGNELLIDNSFGIDGIRQLKRRNGFGEPCGQYDGLFEVHVDEAEDKLKITLYHGLVQYHEGNIEEAFLEAIRIIDTHYNSVGWEFLTNPI